MIAATRASVRGYYSCRGEALLCVHAKSMVVGDVGIRLKIGHDDGRKNLTRHNARKIDLLFALEIGIDIHRFTSIMLERCYE